MAGPQVRMPLRSGRGHAHPVGQLLLENSYHRGGEASPFSEGAGQAPSPFRAVGSREEAQTREPAHWLPQ